MPLANVLTVVKRDRGPPPPVVVPPGPEPPSPETAAIFAAVGAVVGFGGIVGALLLTAAINSSGGEILVPPAFAVVLPALGAAAGALVSTYDEKKGGFVAVGAGVGALAGLGVGTVGAALIVIGGFGLVGFVKPEGVALLASGAVLGTALGARVPRTACRRL